MQLKILAFDKVSVLAVLCVFFQGIKAAESVPTEALGQDAHRDDTLGFAELDPSHLRLCKRAPGGRSINNRDIHPDVLLEKYETYNPESWSRLEGVASHSREDEAQMLQVLEQGRKRNLVKDKAKVWSRRLQAYASDSHKLSDAEARTYLRQGKWHHYHAWQETSSAKYRAEKAAERAARLAAEQAEEHHPQAALAVPVRSNDELASIFAPY
ncbi:hypothetical protein CBS101457_003323 [Exobasidium rhododendri]|nr:hypothetical protein CBS101457_003323 [Exobasidium rhododendri]